MTDRPRTRLAHAANNKSNGKEPCRKGHEAVRGKIFERLKPHSLASRITIQVFLAMLVFAGALWFAVFHITGQWIEKTAMEHLQALATARRAAIESQLRDYLDVMNTFVDPLIKADIEKLLSSERRGTRRAL